MSLASDPFDLSGRTAVVTGARRGVGFGIAVALARAGADVIGISATGDVGRSPVQQAVEGLGRSFTGLQADLSVREDVDRVVEQLVEEHPPVDVLVNNAGRIVRTPALEHDDTIWDHVVEVNLTSVFRLSRAIAPGMISRGRGKIVFVGSILSFQGGINVSSYVASKSGLAGLTKSLANDWAPLGLNVNCIAPGYIRTDATLALQEDEQRYSTILERIPSSRWGVPDDVGGAAVFLASAASDYVNGVVLPVDGGWLGR